MAKSNMTAELLYFEQNCMENMGPGFRWELSMVFTDPSLEHPHTKEHCGRKQSRNPRSENGRRTGRH